MSEPTNNPEQPKKPEKSNFLSRFLVANAFSAIGTKLMFVGTIADLNTMVGPELTLGEKFKTVFSKDIKQKFEDRAKYLQMHEGMSPIKSSFAVAKWTIAIGTVASVSTFVIGWIRGGLIDDWKDIGKHPIRSTKIIFGFEKPPAPKVDMSMPTPATFIAEEPKPAVQKWTDNVASPTSHADAVVQQKAAETSAFVG